MTKPATTVSTKIDDAATLAKAAAEKANAALQEAAAKIRETAHTAVTKLDDKLHEVATNIGAAVKRDEAKAKIAADAVVKKVGG